MAPKVFAQLTINPDFKYGVHYLGEVAGQGGITFGWSYATFSDLESAIKFLKYVTRRAEKRYKTLISEKSA